MLLLLGINDANGTDIQLGLSLQTVGRWLDGENSLDELAVAHAKSWNPFPLRGYAAGSKIQRESNIYWTFRSGFKLQLRFCATIGTCIVRRVHLFSVAAATAPSGTTDHHSSSWRGRDPAWLGQDRGGW